MSIPKPAIIPSDSVPSYAQGMAAYHREYGPELREIIMQLPLVPGSVAVDVGCGDGTYLALLAEHPSVTHVIGVDNDPGYLEVARRVAAEVEGARIELREEDALSLELPDESVDFVWCAQSLYSLPDPGSVLREAKRVSRPGGMVGILENDTLHHLLLPLPVDLELEVKRAEYKAFCSQGGDPERFYIPRALPQLCRAAGFDHVTVKTYAHTRFSPFTEDELAYVAWFVDTTLERLRGNLSREALERLEGLVDLGSSESLLSQTDAAVTCLDYLILARSSMNETIRRSA